MSKSNALTLGILAVVVALLCVGCGEEERNFLDPNEAPPLSAEATSQALAEVLPRALEKVRGEKVVEKAIQDGMGAAEAYRTFGIL